MPFISNPNNNTVVYSSPNWEHVILNEKYEVDSAGYGPASSQTGHGGGEDGTTLRTITPLDINIGKYERMLITYKVWWTQNTTGRAKFKINTPDSVTSIHTSITGKDTHTSAIAVGVVTTADPTYTNDIQGTAGYAEFEMQLENGATAGAINFQFGQVANNAAPAIVLAGSSLAYKRF